MIAAARAPSCAPAPSTSPPTTGTPDDRTVLRVPQPQPVGPGQTIEVELRFTAKRPPHVRAHRLSG
jgi:hypothetical protein